MCWALGVVTFVILCREIKKKILYIECIYVLYMYGITYHYHRQQKMSCYSGSILPQYEFFCYLWNQLSIGNTLFRQFSHKFLKHWIYLYICSMSRTKHITKQEIAIRRDQLNSQHIFVKTISSYFDTLLELIDMADVMVTNLWPFSP